MIKSKKTTEAAGVVYGFIAAALWALFPVLTNQGTKTLPPISFIAIVTAIGAIAAFFYALMQKKLGELKKREAYSAMIMITLCVVVFPSAMIAVGSSMTSGTNTSALLLAEIIYTVIITHFYGEKTSLLKILGAIGILCGSALLVYNGKAEVNIGDVIILLAPVTYPIGNFFSKKALHHVSPATILATRFLLGAIFLYILSLVLEPGVSHAQIFTDNIVLIIFFGFVVLGFGRVLAYESLKRLDISKFVFIANTFPLFSLLYLVFVFNEKISSYQAVGIAIMMTGVYFAIKRPSVESHKTKYAKAE